MTLVIREAQLADARGIAEVHVRTWQHAYLGQVPDDFLAQLQVHHRAEQWKSWLTEPLPRSSVLVAEIDESIVGFCWVGPSRDEDADSDTGELYAIYVLPVHQGHGTGDALMTQGLSRLTENSFHAASLWVLKTNSAARAFYGRSGWAQNGAEKSEQWHEVNLEEVLYRIKLVPSM